MKYRFILMTLLGFCFVYPCLAKDQTEEEPPLPAFAAKVEARYQSAKSWQAGFIQKTHIEILNQELEKRAKIIVQKPDQIRIEYLTDPQKVYVSNGKKLWVYKNDDDSAMEFDDPNRVLSEEALSFLSGLQNLSELFTVVQNMKETPGYYQIKNKTLTKISLIPNNEESAMLKVTLGVDSKKYLIKEAVLYNASGNITHYTFENILFDQTLDPLIFSLPKEPKRKIIRK